MTDTPDPTVVALETVIRSLLAEHPDMHLQASFYRGATSKRGPLDEWTKYEEVSTPAFDGEWFVKVKPTSFDVIVSAAGRYEWGAHDVIGDAVEVRLPRIKGRPDAVDIEALSGSKLHVELLAAIREKAAVVEQMRAAVGS